MSKGRPILATRCDQDLVDELDAQVESLFMNARGRHSKEWHRAEFIRTAIREKLDKMKRSRGERMRKLKGKEDEAGECQSAPPV